MRSTMFLAILSFALLAPACPPDPPKPPVPPDSGDAGPPPIVDAGGDASPATIYDRACSAIAAAGCPEGAKPNCAATMKHMAESGISPIDPKRCADAKTKADVRACGAIRCQ